MDAKELIWSLLLDFSTDLRLFGSRVVMLRNVMELTVGHVITFLPSVIRIHVIYMYLARVSSVISILDVNIVKIGHIIIGQGFKYAYTYTRLAEVPGVAWPEKRFKKKKKKKGNLLAIQTYVV